MSFPVLFVLAFAIIIASRVLLERQLRTLTPEQKVVLVDAFARQRMFAFVPLVAIFIASAALMYAFPSTARVVMWGTWVALGGYVIYLSFTSARRLQALSMPSAYVRVFVISRVLQVLALVLIFVGFAGSPRVG